MIGTGRQVVLPGFVNATDHIGLTPVQHGSPDMPTRAHRGVDLVIVAGELVYQGGRFTRVDRDAAPRELHQSLQGPLAEGEVERRRLSKALLPHVRRFDDRYFDPKTHLPYYRASSRE
jgi:hypothetical protein